MSKCLLIVDDSRLSRMMISTFINESFPDCHILEAENGEKALKLVAEQSIDMATIDLNMPGMNGLTLGIELRKRFPDARLTMLTANVQSSIRQKVEQAGLEFIAKPVTQDKIDAFMKECVS